MDTPRPTVGQAQLSQGPQRKHPRAPTFNLFVMSPQSRPRSPIPNPSVASPESNMANSSPEIETGNTPRGDGTQKPTYEAWSDGAQSQLFQWLELPGNYDKWKCAGVKSSGVTRSSGLTKKAVTKLMSHYLVSLQTQKTPEQVMTKMRYVEKKFKEAEDYLSNTGEGLTSNDKKMGITVIRDKVLTICPFYYQVKPIMSEAVSVNPPYVGETGANENFEDLLGLNLATQRFYESRAEDDHNLPSEDDTSNADEEPEESNFEATLHTDEESGPQDPSQAAVPEVMQGAGTSNSRPKEKKKKPKSFQESIQDVQDQNRVLMEKKFTMQQIHQDKRYALESRRLDLEFHRMNQQRQDSLEERQLRLQELNEARELRIQETRIRELALQVELEKLRRS